MHGGLRQRRLRKGLKQAELARRLIAAGYPSGQVNVERRLLEWESGRSTPRPKTQESLAGILDCTPTDLFPATDVTEQALTYHRSLTTTLDTVAELGRQDMDRRGLLKGTLFSVAAAVGPSRDWLINTLREAATARRRVNASQVESIRATFGAFQEMDVMHGGGFARHRLAAFLTDHVVPLLRANDPATDVGRSLFEAGSEQYYLLGWMAYDNGEHALAQRYLIQALRLAEASRSVELGAHILAGLSDQATLTGHPGEGLKFAEAGQIGLAKGHSDACLADLLALEARALAAMGDGRSAARRVAESERRFADVDHTREPEWARFIDVAYLNGEYANAFRDLADPTTARGFAELSAADAARQGRGRRGALAHATLARAALDDHDLIAASAEGIRTANLAVGVDSSRSREAITDLRVRMRKHRRSGAVREFLDATDTLLG